MEKNKCNNFECPYYGLKKEIPEHKNSFDYKGYYMDQLLVATISLHKQYKESFMKCKELDSYSNEGKDGKKLDQELMNKFYEIEQMNLPVSKSNTTDEFKEWAGKMQGIVSDIIERFSK